MILLLGGTSDTAPLALALATRGYRVLVSRATDARLPIGEHPRIEGRSGPLDDEGLAGLIRQRGIQAIVDATHPYAVTIRARAARIARSMSLPHFTFVRPATADASDPNVQFVSDHALAAQAAFAHGRPVLLTTGSRNLTPYVEASRRSGLTLIVRVLDHAASLAACHAAGLPDDRILAGRGPFSVETNRQQIRAFRIGVLVTKDGGQAGGTAEKLEAARIEGCRVIVVERPKIAGKEVFTSIDAIVEAVLTVVERDGPV